MSLRLRTPFHNAPQPAWGLWVCLPATLSGPWDQMYISSTYHSLPLLSGASSHRALLTLPGLHKCEGQARTAVPWLPSKSQQKGSTNARKEAQVMRQWRWPGRMCCSGAEGNVDPGRGKEVETKQRLQRWRGRGHCPIPSSCSHLPSSSPGPNKSGASQPGWRLSKVFCPHCLAIVLLKRDEKASGVPSYLPRMCGLVSREQSPQTFCDGKHCGSELLPCLPEL